MARWDDDDYWDDAEEPAPQVPVTGELEGAVYMIPDRIWGFHAVGREHHPGVCIRCDLPARLAFLYKGTDVGASRPDRFLNVIVEPSETNGLRGTNTKSETACLSHHHS